MLTSLLGSHNQTAMSWKFQRQFQIAVVRMLLIKALQDLKEATEFCDIFSATNFQPFQVHLFKLLQLRLTNQSHCDFLINILLFHLIIRDHSHNTFHNQKWLTLKKFCKNRLNFNSDWVWSFFTHTKISPQKAFCGNAGIFLNESATHCSSLTFNADN